MNTLLLRLALLMVVSFNFGCARMATFESTETAWQIAHLIDVGQTVAIAKNPDCYHEAMPDTRALIGHHPKESDVYKWGVGMAIFHYFTRKWVDDTFSEKLSVGIRSYDLGFKINTIKNNHQLGLRVDGSSTAKAMYHRGTGEKVKNPNGKTRALCSNVRPDVSTGFTWKF